MITEVPGDVSGRAMMAPTFFLAASFLLALVIESVLFNLEKVYSERLAHSSQHLSSEQSESLHFQQDVCGSSETTNRPHFSTSAKQTDDARKENIQISNTHYTYVKCSPKQVINFISS